GHDPAAAQPGRCAGAGGRLRRAGSGVVPPGQQTGARADAGRPMISHLRGRLARKHETESSVELDVGGVWYEVELPAFVWRALEDAEVGSELELETFYFVTANAPIPRLIGFQREVEREFFKKLVTVPNVGPTTATRALAFSVSTIAQWIEAGDTVSLSR